MIKSITLFLAVIFCTFSVSAQITTTVNPTIAQLQQKLSGNGVTITNLTVTCPDPTSYALYSNATGALSTLSSGILLTTGSATNVAGPTDPSVSNSFGMPGSALGYSLAGDSTHDGCYITFEITPTCHTLSINYVFASNEYSDYVGTINDVFGFVISGPNPSGGNYAQTNIATVPGTTLAVSIDNVNNGVGTSFLGIPPSGPCMNCAYFQDAPAGMVYNGSTTVLTASTAVIPCQTYTMTIGVWDVGDDAVDSGVFLDVNGLSCIGSPTISAVVSPSVICGPQTITLTAGGGIASGTYTWSAPASGGLTSTTGSIVTANPIAPTTYTLAYSDINTCPGSPIIKTTSITFTPLPAFSITQNPIGSICIGQTATLTANGSGGIYSWSPSSTLSSSSGSIVVSTPTANTTYTVLQSVGTCTSSSVISVTVSSAAPIAITPSSSVICSGQNITLSSSGSGPFAWTASSGINPPSSATIIVSPTVSTTYTVISGVGTCTSSAISSVSVVSSVTPTLSASSTTVCLTKTISISASPSGAGISYTWSPSSAIVGSINSSSIVAKPTTSATVIYTVTLSNGLCMSTETISIQVYTCVSPIVGFTTLTNDSICTKGCVSFTSTTTGDPPLTYQWICAGGTSTISTVANPQFCFNASGNYSVGLIASNPYGSDTLIKPNYIFVADTPNVVTAFGDTLIKIGQTAPISVIGGTTYSWSPDNGTIACSTCSSTIVQPTVTTQYIVTAFNSIYCHRQDTITVKIDLTCGDFFIPNVFSPNGDGLNDFVNAHGFCISSYNLQIFNRWGEKVFETTDKSYGWDGSFRGKPMDIGVFMYKVEGITIEGKPFSLKGNVTLLR